MKLSYFWTKYNDISRQIMTTTQVINFIMFKNVYIFSLTDIQTKNADRKFIINWMYFCV